MVKWSTVNSGTIAYWSQKEAQHKVCNWAVQVGMGIHWRLRSACADIRVFDGYSMGSQGSNVSADRKLEIWSECSDSQTDLISETDILAVHTANWYRLKLASTRQNLYSVGSDKARLKPVSSATEIIYNSEISLEANLDMKLSSKRITKAQTSLRVRADWSAPLLFSNPRRQVLSPRGPNRV